MTEWFTTVPLADLSLTDSTIELAFNQKLYRFVDRKQ